MECLQLGRGKRLGLLDSLDLGGQQVVREYQYAAVQKTGATPRNLCTLSFTTLNPAFRFSEHDAGNTGTIFFMSGAAEFDLLVPEGVQTTYVSLDQEDFLTAARVLNPVEWGDVPAGVKPLQSEQRALFDSSVAALFKAAREQGDTFDPGVMRQLLFQAMVRIATQAQKDAGAAPPALRVRALRICKGARACAEDRLETEDLPTIVELCATLGVSERTLQYAFRTHLNMSPLAYLRLLRLNRVRATLRRSSRAETTVTSAAMLHGFLHLGRFSRDYNRVFGELPSTTLAS
ncbi:helix-turn-helix domain-containing protein [Oceanibium sediminis]|uniref:helix-turn-helix domain-containing protein n=1 Tax=Oceanibium sediminis TaxID=2026339 RepID=UPI000DD3F8B6|nr:helix-turn-helix domain-containing protein [Oceanibium sediminis]